MSQAVLESNDPRWVEKIEGLEPEFYDATGSLSSGKDIEMPVLDNASYVPMDDVRTVQQNALATDGIYHCVGFYAEGDQSYLGHLTPGNTGKTSEEVLDQVEENVSTVKYVLGGSPDLKLLEEARNHFSGDESIIYTGNSGSIAVDRSGDIYRFEREEESPLSTTL